MDIQETATGAWASAGGATIGVPGRALEPVNELSAPPGGTGGSLGRSASAQSACAIDDDVWPRLLDADPEAVEILYGRYGALAYALAHRILRDQQEAEDVVQDAFLSLWRNAGTYSAARGSLRSWLCTIVRNRAIDRTRGRAGRSRQDGRLDVSSCESEAVDVCEQVIGTLEGERVRASLSSLPAAQRQTLELAYFDGCTQSEIALRMNVPLGTVKGRTRAGLMRLRELLVDEVHDVTGHAVDRRPRASGVGAIARTSR
jgi:RNA polymerase sigma-70 factor (ECF subfamily)